MQIANIEHEIAVMRERLANIERGARWLWPSFYMMCLGVACAVGYLAMKGEMTAVFVAVVAGAFLALIALALRNGRLVDLASLMDFGFPERSYAIFLEKGIAEREQRLAELKSGQ
jgi:hypothetical protein